MDNKWQFKLRAIIKNNLCEESGRDRSSICRAWQRYFRQERMVLTLLYLEVSRAVETEAINSRERSREPLFSLHLAP